MPSAPSDERPESDWQRCLDGELLGQRVRQVNQKGTRSSCLPFLFDPNEELVERLAKCLGPVTRASAITVRWAQVVEGDTLVAEPAELEVVGDLDMSAESCLLRAATFPPVGLRSDAPRPPRRMERVLRLVTWNAGEQSPHREQPLKQHVIRPLPGLPPRAPLTAGDAAKGKARYDEAAALLRARDLDKAASVAHSCVTETPWYSPCYRLLGSALASLAARNASDESMANAREAYARYLETAPPEDEYVAKVRRLLDAVE